MNAVCRSGADRLSGAIEQVSPLSGPSSPTSHPREWVQVSTARRSINSWGRLVTGKRNKPSSAPPQCLNVVALRGGQSVPRPAPILDVVGNERRGQVIGPITLDPDDVL